MELKQQGSTFFITGTDTGVGKTFFTVSLIKSFLLLGKEVAGFKPIETGCHPTCEDAKALSEASGVDLAPIYSFKTPVAPSVASDIEGVSINLSKLKRTILELSRKFQILLVEGAGGIMVPITWDYLYLDLVKELSLPVLVVALNKLGVINHTLLTVKVCLNEGVDVKGVILNSYKRKDVSFKSNLSSLRRLLPVPVYPFSRPRDALDIATSLIS